MAPNHRALKNKLDRAFIIWEREILRKIYGAIYMKMVTGE